MKKNSKCLNHQCRKYPSFSIIVILIFFVSNISFFYFIYEYQNVPKIRRPPKWPHQFTSLLQSHFQLLHNEWRLTQKRRGDLATSINDYNCTSVRRLHNKQFIATGWTKATYKGLIGDIAVAVKNVNLKGYDVSNCVDNNNDSLFDCYFKVATKLLQEIVRLYAIDHPNIIKVLGYCVPEDPDIDDEKQISIITELGVPIDVIKLLQMSWNDRLKLSLEIARLIHYLTDTTLGPVALNDFRRQQFVFVRNSLQLIDIDDIGTEDPSCDKNPCYIGPMHNKSSSFVLCDHQICKGYNEKLNIINAGKHFIKHILPHGVPSQYIVPAREISKAYSKASWDSLKILKETEKLIEIYKKTIVHGKT